MNILGKLLENPNELLGIVVSLIEDEKKRISDNKLANGEQWGSSIQPVMKAIGKNAEEHRKWNVVIGQLSGLHNILKSIKLPGDFEKHSEEKFYIVLDLPYDGEKFHDLSSLPKKEDKKDTDCPECEKEEKEEDCVDCAEDGENVQDILADVVNKHLRKIAEVLGDKGDHEAAYLVERTMRSISREAGAGGMFGEMEQMENRQRQQKPQGNMQGYWDQMPQAPAAQPAAMPPPAGGLPNINDMWKQQAAALKQQQAAQAKKPAPQAAPVAQQPAPQASPQRRQQLTQQQIMELGNRETTEQFNARTKGVGVSNVPNYNPNQPVAKPVAKQPARQPAQPGQRQMRQTSPKVQQFGQSATPAEKAKFNAYRKSNPMQSMDSIVDMITSQR